MKQPILTAAAAKILDCTPAWVRRLEANGILPATRTSNGVRLFDPEDVARLARARQQRRGRRPARG